jgi:hypothetical protein
MITTIITLTDHPPVTQVITATTDITSITTTR